MDKCCQGIWLESTRKYIPIIAERHQIVFKADVLLGSLFIFLIFFDQIFLMLYYLAH